MLVLTRKQNEKIRIGDSITITVLRMKGKAVRLGIEAPHDINVIRGELCFDLGEESTDSLPDVADQTDERLVPPKSKPLISSNSNTTSAVAKEETSHWPVESSQASHPPTANCTVPLGVSPLRAMLEART